MTGPRALRTLLPALAVLAALLAPAPQAAAHPHVFMDNMATFVFDDQGLAGFRLSWLFDDMFGATVIEDYDRDGDGDFSPGELAVLKAEVFDYLSNSDWFTFVEIDGVARRTTEVRDFSARISAGRLLYEFFVPCPVPAGAGERRVLLSVHDPEYYADVYSPEDKAPELENAEAFEVQTSVSLNPERTYSPFQAWLPEIHLSFRRR
ncbi:DUF1007 family protein [Desulfocurvus vexinensis]|uniref:DUF1007 family protein n=1 Tax=Desulfocurvus vexinensis TaxID=399548 RepID=UPI0004AF8856|nr:DUF1007 family protein [Desulfocurvus vexinensis]